jgi:hypothetical protein
VAKGYAQIAGVKFMDTFAPNTTFVSLRLLLTVAAKCAWPVYSFDFVAAYLHLPINKDVWVSPLEGLEVYQGTCLQASQGIIWNQEGGQMLVETHPRKAWKPGVRSKPI